MGLTQILVIKGMRTISRTTTPIRSKHMQTLIAWHHLPVPVTYLSSPSPSHIPIISQSQSHTCQPAHSDCFDFLLAHQSFLINPTLPSPWKSMALSRGFIGDSLLPMGQPTNTSHSIHSHPLIQSFSNTMCVGGGVCGSMCVRGGGGWVGVV